MTRNQDAANVNGKDVEGRGAATPDGAANPFEARIAQLEEQLLEAEDSAVRARAEVQNIKRRQREEIERIQDTATEHFVKELLPVVDDMERALGAAGATHNFEALSNGVELVLNKLLAALRSVGVERMQGVGVPFDPEMHEAVQQVEPSDEFPSGTIAQELRSGYTQHGHVVRPSLVGVAHE